MIWVVQCWARERDGDGILRHAVNLTVLMSGIQKAPTRGTEPRHAHAPHELYVAGNRLCKLYACRVDQDRPEASKKQRGSKIGRRRWRERERESEKEGEREQEREREQGRERESKGENARARARTRERERERESERKIQQYNPHYQSNQDHSLSPQSDTQANIPL